METDAAVYVYVRTVRARDAARGREGKRGLSETRAICETQWKRVLEKGAVGRPSTRYIDRRLRSAIPHFKGKISVYSGRLLPRNYSEELASRIAAQMENNVTFCSWQVSREPGGAFLSSFASFASPLSFPLEISACPGSRAQRGRNRTAEFADLEFGRVKHTYARRGIRQGHSPTSSESRYLQCTSRYASSRTVIFNKILCVTSMRDWYVERTFLVFTSFVLPLRIKLSMLTLLYLYS